MKERIGLLVMDYGTPNCEADLMPYYTSIRRGYAPTEAEVAVLKNAMMLSAVCHRWRP